MTENDPLLSARASVLHDLAARGYADASAVSILEDVLAQRRWWLEQWPAGAAYVAGQVAQDVQDKLFDLGIGRWPRCASCDLLEEHELRITPDLGPDSRWVCEQSGIEVAPLGSLPSDAAGAAGNAGDAGVSGEPG